MENNNSNHQNNCASSLQLPEQVTTTWWFTATETFWLSSGGQKPRGVFRELKVRVAGVRRGPITLGFVKSLFPPGQGFQLFNRWTDSIPTVSAASVDTPLSCDSKHTNSSFTPSYSLEAFQNAGGSFGMITMWTTSNPPSLWGYSAQTLRVHAMVFTEIDICVSLSDKNTEPSRHPGRLPSQ